MKASKLTDIKLGFKFEAPIIPAKAPKGLRHIESHEQELFMDLYSYLAPKPGDVFLVRVSGESMVNENINDGDILVVNRKETPKNGKIVVASLNGEMTVKILRQEDGKVVLFSANDNFLPKEIGPYMEFQIQGVVKHVIRKLR